MINYKASFYALLTVFIVTLVFLGAYYIINYDKNKLDNTSVKIAFDADLSCGPGVPESFIMKRTFKTYTLLSSDTVHNLKVLRTVKQELNRLKENHDSIHGIKVSFANDILYKDYLQLVSICTEKEPKYFIPYENSIYAIAKSKYQMREDSIIEADYKNMIQCFSL